MNNEELKKKIAKIIDTTEKPCNCLTVSECLAKTGCKYHNRNDGTTCFSYARAEALIAAGYGDVKKAEHRMSVMQLALKNACEIVFSQEIDVEDWDDVIFNYKKEKGIREIGITPNILYDYLKEQAEKELAEEEKNEQRNVNV